MKVLLVQHTDVLGGSLQGALQLTKTLNKCLDEIDLEVYINNIVGNAIPFAKENKIRLAAIESGVPTFDYFNGCNSSIRIFIKYLFTFYSIIKWKKFLQREKYDFVILNTSVLWPLCHVAQNAGAKCICYIRETVKGDNNSIINRIIRSKLSKCDALFYLSKYDSQTWDIDNRQIYIVPESVDDLTHKNGITRSSIRKKLGLKEDDFYILYIGGMQRLKGPDIIIQALNTISESHPDIKNLKLIFLGYSDNTDNKFIDRIKYYKQIKYIGLIKKMIENSISKNKIIKINYQTNIYDWMIASDLLVFPATKVHQARPLYEAGMVHRTAILPDFENYYENLINNYNGFVFIPGDYRDLSKKILYLYNHPQVLLDLSENNFSMTMKKHTQENLCILIKNVLEEFAISNS